MLTRRIPRSGRQAFHITYCNVTFFGALTLPYSVLTRACTLVNMGGALGKDSGKATDVTLRP